MQTLTRAAVPEERPGRPRPPHPRRRLPRGHGHGAQPGFVPVRRPERPADPRLLLLLRDPPGRLQPPEDAGPGVPGGPHGGGADEALHERHLHRALRPIRRDLFGPRGPALPLRSHVLRRGRHAGDREHAEDRLRLEDPKEPGARQGREGHEDPALPERLPRPVGVRALDDEHGRSAQDPVLPQVRLAAPVLPAPLVPGHRAGDPRRGGRRGGRRARDPGRGRREPGRHRGADPRAHPGRGRRQPLPPRALPPAAPARRRARVPPHLRRGPDGRRPDRLDVVLAADGRRARHVRLRQEDPGLRLRVQSPRSTTSRTTSSRSRPASTRRGAATSST